MLKHIWRNRWGYWCIVMAVMVGWYAWDIMPFAWNFLTGSTEERILLSENIPIWDAVGGFFSLLAMSISYHKWISRDTKVKVV